VANFVRISVPSESGHDMFTNFQSERIIFITHRLKQ
jgi:hypothetical protein